QRRRLFRRNAAFANDESGKRCTVFRLDQHIVLNYVTPVIVLRQERSGQRQDVFIDIIGLIASDEVDRIIKSYAVLFFLRLQEFFEIGASASQIIGETRGSNISVF